jgi:predicted nuclease with TOPRIM domain
MSDQDFRERVLSALERLEQKYEQLDQKFEQKFDALDQKFEKKFDSLDQKFEQRFDALETRMGLLEQGVSWVRGKLEGRAEVGAVLVSRIAVGTAIVSTIIALFALFRS